MLVGQYALYAKLDLAYLAVGLDGLNVGDVSVAELLDDSVLVDQRFVGVEVEQAVAVVVFELVAWRVHAFLGAAEQKA